MSDYYQQFFSGPGETPPVRSQDPQAPPQNFQHPMAAMGGGGTPMTGPYQSLGYFTGFPDPIMFQPPKAQGSRSRRKSAPGLEHVKHRRTRSGCYTCRSRRVKCDETHPVCERCRKGKRECVYPEPSPSKGQAGSASSKESGGAEQLDSPESSQDGAGEESEKESKLDPIIDEDELQDVSPRASRPPTSLRRKSTSSTLNLQKSSLPQSPETPSSSPSVSTGTSASFPITFHASETSMQSTRPDWSHLPADFRFYLDYFCEHLTHYSYCFVVDPEGFFHTFLPSVAIKPGNEPLLNALVGFSAYHYTVQEQKTGIQEFLQYYNKSVTMLLNSFKKREPQDTATLLTILQLATIEEYLGDWVNLMGHQKAALQVLMQLFTPQTAIQSSINRMILTWYARFDLFVGMIGGFDTKLPREWFSEHVEFLRSQITEAGSDLGKSAECVSADLRLISFDMSSLYAKGARKEISDADFAREHSDLTSRLNGWRDNLDPIITDPIYLVTDFKHRRPLEEGDIVDPYAKGYLYELPLFSTTILVSEWCSVVVMHKSQEALTLQQEPSEELRSLVFTICQIFETILRWPSTPHGAIFTLHAGLAIATLFLPRDVKHHLWMRRKFAMIEAQGYVFPRTMRQRMSQLFQDSSCVHWWLANEEGMTPIIKSIRSFADDRNANPVSEQTESLREMSAIFTKMRLDFDETPSPMESPGIGSMRGKGKDVG